MCRDVTAACYFHTEKIFTVPVKIKACEDITFIQGIKYFMAEIVIKWFICTVTVIKALHILVQRRRHISHTKKIHHSLPTSKDQAPGS